MFSQLWRGEIVKEVPTRVSFRNDDFGSNFDVVPVPMDKQGSRDPERPLLLLVEEHWSAAGALESDDPRQ